MIQIAVIGPGKISHRFMEGMKYVSNARVSAFVSRHAETVSEYAEQYGIIAVGSMEDILLKHGIDAVYISSPNHVHNEQITFCLKHGIHVLCEKPIVLTAREYRDLLALAHERNLVLMEAQKTLYTPTFQAIRSVLQEGTLGTVTEAEAGFCRNSNLSETAWRMTEPGKGALYDVGCYPLAALFGLFGCGFRELGRTEKYLHDTDIGGIIRLSDGKLPITVHYSMAESGLCDLNITGTKGTLSCHEFWKANSFTLTVNGVSETRSFPFESEFTFEAQRFVDRIEHGESQDGEHERISTSVLEILER